MQLLDILMQLICKLEKLNLLKKSESRLSLFNNILKYKTQMNKVLPL